MKALAHIPPPADRRIALRVKPAAEKALRRGHPWLFDKSIRRQSHEGRPGDLGVIFDARDRFLAIGLYDPESPIRLRILQSGRPAQIDGDWFRAKLTTVFGLRDSLVDSSTTGYRLVHGENDGLPGFVLDRYGDSCVVRLDTAAWLPHLNQVLPPVLDILPVRRVILRVSRRLQGMPSMLHGLHDGEVLHGAAPEGPVLFQENGLCFESDLIHGQKTGFFLDQRDNRSRVESLVAQDRSLRRVLNVFAYSGAFGVYAVRGGAERVLNVDASEAALASARRNMRLNSSQWPARSITYRSITGDAFEVMEGLGRKGRQFDVVIVDPPSFAKDRREVGRAKAAYRRLARLGLALLRHEGLLVSASCSSRLDAETFFQLVNRSASKEGRPLREVARTGHPMDHPIGFPEGAYLKCLFARVP